MGARAIRWIPLLVMVWAGTGTGNAAERELIVSAAASLTNAFQAVKPAFEEVHPETRIILNFAASGSLLQQIDQGAPVDVFASADQETMDRAEDKGLIHPDSRVDFARNVLVLVAPLGSDRTPADLDGLREEGVRRIAVGDPSYVPAGRYARQALRSRSLWDVLQPKYVYANSVRQVLDYVGRGEVEAGIVYRTDVRLRRDTLREVTELGGHSPILYPVAEVRASVHGDAAARFVAFLRTPAAQNLLEEHGFQAP